ncbi:MAG: exodeoxyribonuclease III [Alphaproteobacteria bacterium]|nr:exodeoxyribonuclease III [Alphaproteobacteria bacterium]
MTEVKIVSWNVNSIKMRLINVLNWLQKNPCDVVLLQEIKTIDEKFPFSEFEDLGYNIKVVGQKSYNGVCILSRHPMTIEQTKLPGSDHDEQARYLEALIEPKNYSPFRVASLYAPNGNPVHSEKFPYKITWMDRLIVHAKTLLSYEEILVLAGDYNIIPDDCDVYDPVAWADDALFCKESKNKFYELCHLGLTDALRLFHQTGIHYSFWDYTGGHWQKNEGLRIDHMLLSPLATDRVTSCFIDKEPRGWDKPSDHAPIWCTLNLA